jgi:biopolymer transport protein ExbD/biopolymer transport protein TolR
MSKSRDTFNEINITPLTDIFLVLLIIMMVIAPMLDQQGLNLTVPENVAEEQVQNKETKIMTIMVDASDNYYLDGQQIAVANLEDTIKAQSKEYPDGLLIKVDSDSSHGAMVKVMDCARNSGVTSISVDEI